MFCTLHSPVIDSTVTQEGFTLIQVLCTLYSPVTELENTVTRSPKLKTGYCRLKEVRSKISILLETTGGILFQWRGLKKGLLQLKLYAG